MLRWGLVKYSAQADIVFPASDRSEQRLMVKRPVLDGRGILNMKRTDFIQLQPSLSRFIASFNRITGNLLNKLEWDHVFVAAGMPLSCLLCMNLEVDADKYRNSDIDLYIYGLNPLAANEKIDHIYNTWLSNLPLGSEPHALRNSCTIT